jgi:16S rRNA (guanine527-N7)-methyltransferase
MSLTPIEIYQAHRSEFDRYQALLLKWNQKINLTSITEPEEISEKHFLDSLSVIPCLQQWLPQENVSRETFSGISLLDLGTGAGFPGIPIKIALPALKMTLVDSIKKKCDFVKEVIRALSLANTEVRNLKVREGETVGRFDIIVSRATLSLGEFVRVAAPSLKPNGLIIAYKGADIESEIQDSLKDLKDHSLRPFEVTYYCLPHSKVERTLVMTGRTI